MNEINFWYKGKFYRKQPIHHVEYFKKHNMLRITEGACGLYNISHWDVSKIYNLNVK